MQSNQHPLSLYANELVQSTREKMSTLLERYYDSISVDDCAHILGFEAGEMDAMKQYLEQERKWERNPGRDDIYVPVEAMGLCASGLGGVVKTKGKNEADKSLDKIQFLTNVVGFMEMQRMNA